MITADQLLLHAIGDYVLQSDSMANGKTKSWMWAWYHATFYSLPFWLLTRSLTAWLVIFGTHMVIDRYRLARYVVWFKNALFGSTPPWRECTATGNAPSCPPFLSVWLMIIADNILHVVINGAALRYL